MHMGQPRFDHILCAQPAKTQMSMYINAVLSVNSLFAQSMETENSWVQISKICEHKIMSIFLLIDQILGMFWVLKRTSALRRFG